MKDAVLISAAVIFTTLQALAARKNFYSREYGFMAENIFLCAAVDLLMAFNSRFPYPFHPFILICLAASIAGDAFLGKTRDLYHRSVFYGRSVHLLGCFSFALFVYGIFRNLFGQVRPDAYLPAVVVASGISVGVIFEIFEFVMDASPKKKRMPKRQHGLADTDFDLLFDAIGSLLAGIAARFLFL